jgi:hypothetical protein
MAGRYHDPVAGMDPVPHGPDDGLSEAPYPAQPSKENEARIFKEILKPDDSYTAEGVYWADMKLGSRAKFVTQVNNAEALKELRVIGSMMKKDPLSPIGWYFRHAILPGAGLGLEG